MTGREGDDGPPILPEAQGRAPERGGGAGARAGLAATDADASAGAAPEDAAPEDAADAPSPAPDAAAPPVRRPADRFPDAAFPIFGHWDRPGFRAAALVIAVDGHQRALMQLRDDRSGVAHAGFWGPFGGGVERGESLGAAAVREFREETGLTLREAALRPMGRTLSPSPTRTRLYVFATRLAIAPSAVRLSEGAGFAFLSTDMLRRARVVPVMERMVRALADTLAGGGGP